MWLQTSEPFSVSQIAGNQTSGGPARSTESLTAKVRIEQIVAGGFGLARHERRVLFVPMTAPGDIVEIELPAKGPRASLVRVIEAGPGRTAPLCRHYGRCGGCDLMHLSYEAQSEAKLNLVVDAMRRIGGDLELPGLALVPNPKPFGSRIRATWRPTDDGRAGYLRRGSHEVIPIGHCPVLDPVLESTRSSLTICAPIQGLTNGSEVSIGRQGDNALELEFTVAGEQLRASADLFFQASSSLLEEFVARVVHEASRGCPKYVLELYAGSGLFTVPLARRVSRIESAESSKRAVEFARANAAKSGLTNVTVHESTVERWLAPRRMASNPGVVLVDPPRVGLSRQVADQLVAIGPARIVYVSCDPATFARDARTFADGGYRIDSWTAFDLFPQTHHVELVARFERIGH